MTRLNLGCGGNILDGWENHDADVDISRPLPWANESVDFILAEHVVEHIAPAEALSFLREARRILKPDGVLRLCIPVLDRLTNEHAEDIIRNHGHRAAYNTDLVLRFLMISGFSRFFLTGRKDCDGHWRVIGRQLDDRETCRVEAVK